MSKFKVGKIVKFKTILTEDDLKKRKENKEFCPYYYKEDIGIILELVEDGSRYDHALVITTDGSVGKLFYNTYEISYTRGINEKLRTALEAYYLCYKNVKKLEAKHNEIKEKLNKEMTKMKTCLTKDAIAIQKVTKKISKQEFIDFVCNEIRDIIGENHNYHIHAYAFGKKKKPDGIKEYIGFKIYYSADVGCRPSPQNYSFLYYEYDDTVHFVSGYEKNSEYKRIIQDGLLKYKDKMNIFEKPDKETIDLLAGDKHLEFRLEYCYDFLLDAYTEKAAKEVVKKICKNIKKK